MFSNIPNQNHKNYMEFQIIYLATVNQQMFVCVSSNPKDMAFGI